MPLDDAQIGEVMRRAVRVHPNVEELVDFVHDRLDVFAHLHVAAHLNQCGACRERYRSALAASRIVAMGAPSEEERAALRPAPAPPSPNRPQSSPAWTMLLRVAADFNEAIPTVVLPAAAAGREDERLPPQHLAYVHSPDRRTYAAATLQPNGDLIVDVGSGAEAPEWHGGVVHYGARAFPLTPQRLPNGFTRAVVVIDRDQQPKTFPGLRLELNRPKG